MNTQRSTHKTVSLLAVFAGLLMLSTTAQAHWLSPAFYGDDLERCTVEMRSELNTTGATGLQHTVTDIEKIGVWYVFDIETNIVDDAGAVIRRATTRCKSHRWTEKMVVEVTNQSPTTDMRVVSTN